MGLNDFDRCIFLFSAFGIKTTMVLFQSGDTYLVRRLVLDIFDLINMRHNLRERHLIVVIYRISFYCSIYSFILILLRFRKL